MLTAVSVIFPVIAIIALGFFLVRANMFTPEQNTALMKFVFMIAAPALLFRNVAVTEFPETTPWGLWLSYYLVMFGCMALSIGLARLLLPRRSGPDCVIIGFGSSFSNTVMLGIPIILTAFGEAAALPLFLVLAFHGLLIFSTGILLMELSTSSSRSLRGAISALPQALSNQTVLIALLAGVLWNMSGLNLPDPADRFLDILGQAAIPLALVAIGGTLATVPVRRSVGVAAYMSGFKLMVQPAATYSVANYVFGLPPLWVATITLLAAMPTGVLASVLAEQYRSASGAASSSIMVSSITGIATLSFWLFFFAPFLHS
ncbi:MAG: AEC family transporter [Pseudomonadota bacterium]|nr:AEC family transporter [Pseudomonadota bacterium]